MASAKKATSARPAKAAKLKAASPKKASAAKKSALINTLETHEHPAATAHVSNARNAALASVGKTAMGGHPYFDRVDALRSGLKASKVKAKKEKATKPKAAKPIKVAKVKEAPVPSYVFDSVVLNFNAKSSKTNLLNWSTDIDSGNLKSCEELAPTADIKPRMIAFSKLGLMTFFLTYNKAGEASIAQKVGKANALTFNTQGVASERVKKLSLKKGSLVMPLTVAIEALGVAGLQVQAKIPA